MDTRPILWHIPISHYNEKVRWALDYKEVDHELRAPLPGPHMAVAFALTGGRHYTFPVLKLDGRRIGDSTAIIAALEERFPEPPLYPQDPAERARALELEDWFDRELGPHIRRYVFHAVGKDRELSGRLSSQVLPRRLQRFSGLAGAYARVFTGLRFRAGSDSGADEARERVLIALDELESQLNGNEYLVGEHFTVADLTAAALFYPLALPPEGPQSGIPREVLADLIDPVADRRGVRWIREMFRRHRRRWATGIHAERATAHAAS
jgi:glutathione S-transferase